MSKVSELDLQEQVIDFAVRTVKQGDALANAPSVNHIHCLLLVFKSAHVPGIPPNTAHRKGR